MMKLSFFRLTVLACCLSVVSMGGCVRTKPSKFYRLDAVSSSGLKAQASDTARELAIGVGPVELPQYLDRPHIVVNASGNEYEISGFDRWAEPLRDNITNILGENLSTILGSERITVFPWIDSSEIDYQVVVQVINFEGVPGGQVSLNTKWVIKDVKDEKEILAKMSSLSGSAGGEGYDALVAAQSRLLGDLSSEIAEAIRGLSHEAGNKE